ncbi:hypothetical protein GUJ93_ZPchr0010g10053 [Zizania palustris]|uniref:Transcription termination and cleavage factor C-terminal domain-containing protein n=1 Tax=Zizania palustris TaxID=103762 RepID=A0A8J5WDK3_ZIZPA|nr:hypothetical protein GUJ93_ZPchr0010g10053 [Zizania palustris]
MIDDDKDVVRRMLIDSPHVARSIFRAQVVLGMVKKTNAVCNLSSSTFFSFDYSIANNKPNFIIIKCFPISQAQSSDMPPPTVAQATPPSSVKATEQDHVRLSQSQLPGSQQNVQPSGLFSSGSSSLPSSLAIPTMSANPPQSAQAKGYPGHHMLPTPITQSTQHQNVTLPNVSSQLSNVPSHMPTVHSQPQQPLQNTGMFNQHLQAPSPQLPRPPNMQPFAHQMRPQAPNSFGLSHANGPQHMLQQSMFHPGGNPQTSFLTGQPPLSNHPLPRQYQASSHVTSHYNSQSRQMDRSTPRGRVNTGASSASSNFPGHLHGFPGQMTQGIGGIHAARPESPLTPEIERMLIQRVLSMSPDQINMLPPEQRQQVLQLLAMLRP